MVTAVRKSEPLGLPGDLVELREPGLLMLPWCHAKVGRLL